MLILTRPMRRITKMGEVLNPSQHWSSFIHGDLFEAFWSSWPNECCGVVHRHQDGHVVFECLENTAISKDRAFEIASNDVLRVVRNAQEDHKRPLAWIHSHPTGDGRCTGPDRAHFWVGDRWIWSGMEQGILWADSRKRLNLSVYGPQKPSKQPKASYSGVLLPLSV